MELWSVEIAIGAVLFISWFWIGLSWHSENKTIDRLPWLGLYWLVIIAMLVFLVGFLVVVGANELAITLASWTRFIFVFWLISAVAGFVGLLVDTFLESRRHARRLHQK